MRASRALPVLVPAVLCTAALSSCGDDESPKRRATSEPAPQGQDGGSRSASSPRALLADVGRSLESLRSYHLELTGEDEDGTSRISADVTTSGSADVTATIGDQGTFRVRKVAGKTYMRGDARYWKVNGGREGSGLVPALANRWIRVEPAQLEELATVFDEVSPKRLARCLTDERTTGTLSLGAPSTVGGKRADVLVDAGDEPGTAPGRLFIAAEGRPLPLRVLQTGRVRPGGEVSDCTDPDDTSTSSDARFSRFDEPVSIRAPKDPIRLPKSGGAEAAGRTSPS